MNTLDRAIIKNILIKLGMNTLVIALALCVPTGVVLTLWFDNIHWLWLCLPLLIFLS